MKHKDIIISFIFGVLSAFVLVVLAGILNTKIRISGEVRGLRRLFSKE